MVVRLQKVDVLPRDARASRGSSAEPTMIADHANIPTCPAGPPDRRLRNLLLLANVAAWVAIIVAIRLVFF